MYLTDGDDHFLGHLPRGHLGDGHGCLFDTGECVRGPELHGLLALPLHRVDGEDVPCTREHSSLESGDTDTTDADDRDIFTRLHVRTVGGRAVTGGNTATHQAGDLERDLWIDLHHRGLVDHHVWRERTEQGHRVDVLAVCGLHAEGVVGHRFSLQEHGPHVAEVAQPGTARRTFAAGGNEREDHMVADLEVGDAFADLVHDSGALMAAEHREPSHRDAAGHQVVIGVAHPGGFHPDLDLALAGVTDLDLFDRPLLVEVPEQSAFGLHSNPPLAAPDAAPLFCIEGDHVTTVRPLQ